MSPKIGHRKLVRHYAEDEKYSDNTLPAINPLPAQF
jgi:hypothetical protein